MDKLQLTPIGVIEAEGEEFRIRLDKRYIPAIKGLEGFGYIQVLWWFDGCDNEIARDMKIVGKPYVNGPDEMGVLATRSPARPNPIALTSAYVTYIDEHSGIIGLAYIDANNGSPVLDIKPYTPGIDRVENPTVPDWCAHWPKCAEESGDFDWESEFNF